MIFGIILMTLLNSCGIYRQNVVNTPMFQEKGQIQLGGHVGFAGYDGQAAFAFTNKIAVMGNYCFTNQATSYSSTNYTKLNHQFYELGLGHFRKSSKNLIHEYFIIVGQGSTSMNVASMSSGVQNYDLRSAKYTRIMLQADFGRITNKFEFGVTPRLFLINYFSNVDTQNNAYLTIPHRFVWSDLAFSIRYSPSKYFKIASQVSCTLPITGLKNGYYEASPFNASLGVIFNVR